MIGGDSVPEVMFVMDCVRMVSMSVADLWKSSYRVGCVIVVWKLFSMRKVVRGLRVVRLRRLMLKSPWIVMVVVGHFVAILLTVSRSAVVKLVGFMRRMLYTWMMVCIGLFFCSFVCMLRVSDGTSSMLMLFSTVACRESFQ